MIVVFTGSNDYMRTKSLVEFRDEFIEKYDDFDVEKIESEKATFDVLMAAVSSVPFMSERKLVVLRGIAPLGLSAEDIDKLIEATSQTTDLLVDEPKFDKRSSVYKKLKKQSDFREYMDLDAQALGRWIVAETTFRGGRINTADARYLLDVAGGDQMMLSNEIDKLLSFEPEISRRSIDMLVDPVPSSKIFDLLDAVFVSNKRRAMDLYNDQRRQNVEPQEIIAMMSWQLHVILLIKYSQLNQITDIASFAKLNPYVVTKTSRLTSNLSEQKVRQLTAKLLELDYNLKTRTMDADDAAQNFILAV